MMLKGVYSLHVFVCVKHGIFQKYNRNEYKISRNHTFFDRFSIKMLGMRNVGLKKSLQWYQVNVDHFSIAARLNYHIFGVQNFWA